MELIRRRDAQVLTGACLTVIGLALVPSTRSSAVVLAAVAAIAAPVYGILVHRPPRRLPWLAVLTMLTLWAAGMLTLTVDPGAGHLAGLLAQSGALVATGLVAALFASKRRLVTSPRRARTRGEALGRRADQYVVGVVVGLGVAQVVVTALDLHDAAENWAVVIAPVDVVLACLLLRFAASRQHVGASGALAMSAALVTATCDALATTGGQRYVLPGDGLGVLWTAAAVLFAASAAHPSMVDLFTPALLQNRRTESARLFGLLPLALAPLALYAIGGTGLGSRLPTPVYLGVAVLVSLLGILRGAQAVRSSERRAARDPLTGLANRRGLAQAFTALMSASTAGQAPVGRICLIDLDDFKHVNDTFGHETGDHLLVAVGQRLESAVGTLGTVARSGGDEFVLLLEQAAPHPDDLVAEVFGAPFTLETPLARRPHLAHASAGWAALHGDSRLAQSLADADVALYATKAGGKGAVTAFHPRLREDVLGRLSMVEDLRRLLQGERDAGHLELRFQPLVDMSGDEVVGCEVVGCEALVRWVHPERGLVPPDAFLGLAEEHGLGAPIDAWVLRAALDQLVLWDRSGEQRLSMSVNLGRSSMLDARLHDVVRAALCSSGIEPHRLHLEITEHAELPPAAGVESLSRLAALGVRVSLDDFGIGYTSLDYIRRYPITTLKVDRSLVESLQEDETSDLLRGVVLLAGCLGIEVLAEGIETTAQHQRLRALGVAMGQGYAFARPLTGDDFSDRVVRRPAGQVALTSA